MFGHSPGRAAVPAEHVARLRAGAHPAGVCAAGGVRAPAAPAATRAPPPAAAARAHRPRPSARPPLRGDRAYTNVTRLNHFI